MPLIKKSGNRGSRCIENEDGSRSCKIYKRQRGEKLATGTDVDLVLDENSCKVRIVGDINDEDREAIERESREMENICRRGF